MALYMGNWGEKIPTYIGQLLQLYLVGAHFVGSCLF